MSHHAKRVVVADDNIDLASSLADLLRLDGHEVWTARDGVEALELVLTTRPDVVILDLSMPNLDGIEAAKRIRALQPPECDALLVALTGLAYEADRRRTSEAGFDVHLAKPTKTADLLQLVEFAQHH